MIAADPLFPQRYLHTIHAATECSAAAQNPNIMPTLPVAAPLVAPATPAVT